MQRFAQELLAIESTNRRALWVQRV